MNEIVIYHSLISLTFTLFLLQIIRKNVMKNPKGLQVKIQELKCCSNIKFYHDIITKVYRRTNLLYIISLAFTYEIHESSGTNLAHYEDRWVDDLNQLYKAGKQRFKVHFYRNLYIKIKLVICLKFIKTSF